MKRTAFAHSKHSILHFIEGKVNILRADYLKNATRLRFLIYYCRILQLSTQDALTLRTVT